MSFGSELGSLSGDDPVIYFWCAPHMASPLTPSCSHHIAATGRGRLHPVLFSSPAKDEPFFLFQEQSFLSEKNNIKWMFKYISPFMLLWTMKLLRLEKKGNQNTPLICSCSLANFSLEGNSLSENAAFTVPGTGCMLLIRMLPREGEPGKFRIGADDRGLCP